MKLAGKDCSNCYFDSVYYISLKKDVDHFLHHRQTHLQGHSAGRHQHRQNQHHRKIRQQQIRRERQCIASSM